MFIIGCNYWASNAGTEMWRMWDEKAIDDDIKRLSEMGMKFLRVFPNWRDFQPVYGLYAGKNRLREYADKDGNKFDNPYFIDYGMMSKFERLCEIADKYDVKLIVGLITGWMSGRMFIPPVLENINLITNSKALELEHKFVKGFVKYFCNNDAIYAWDLGNECNTMADIADRSDAEVWTALIANTIRAYDPKRKPIISGMHGLSVDGQWTIDDQAENNDILTTHPYPQYVPHCFKDDVLSYRTLLHATCESVFYGTIGDKPCLVEEIGTLGPCTCEDDVAAAFLKTNLYSSWANGMLGVMWWCANEQVRLETAPYSWNMMERELGILDADKNPKAMLKEVKNFSEFLGSFNQELPPAKYDGVCIMTKGQDQWGIGYMSYLLAKQAGVNLAFTSYKKELPESEVYLMPSIRGWDVMAKEMFDELIRRVENGATLYISNTGGYLAELEKITGVHIVNSLREPMGSTMKFKGAEISFACEDSRKITSDFAIAHDLNGMPTFIKHPYGKGTVYYLNFSVEEMLLSEHNCESGNHYMIYEEVFSGALKIKPAHKTNKYVGMTLHNKENGYIAVLINYSNKNQSTGFGVADGYEIEKVYIGDVALLEPNGAAVVSLIKK